MVPLYAARVEHLKPDRLIGVECLSCNHLTTVPALMIRAKLAGYVFVKALPRHLRCVRCGERNARLSVRIDVAKVIAALIAGALAFYVVQ